MMSNFVKTINDLPMDPRDDRFFYGIDFVNAIDDGGSMLTPTAVVSAAGQTLNVVAENVSVSGTKVLFRPRVTSGLDATEWDNNGTKVEITCSCVDASGKIIYRSGLLWIAKR